MIGLGSLASHEKNAIALITKYWLVDILCHIKEMYLFVYHQQWKYNGPDCSNPMWVHSLTFHKSIPNPMCLLLPFSAPVQLPAMISNSMFNKSQPVFIEN